MTPAQQQHIEKIVNDFRVNAIAKYEKGANEHGGNLWEVENLVDMAIEELTDGIIYLSTAKEQIKKSGVQLGERKDLIK
jgi:hypothetical protein